ncbi:MAG: hypothetical protein HRU26_01985 [Psychroserpens sp.]|nr:hypothetical protein [Psychroserpens sp.]
MKTLKITFLLLAVVLLAVSGISSDAVVEADEPTFKEYNSQNLLAAERKKQKLETNG